MKEIVSNIRGLEDLPHGDLIKVDKIQENILKNILSQSETKNTINNEIDSNKYKSVFEDIISYALSEKVSDIHFEKRDINSKIRIRKYDRLIKYTDSEGEYIEELCRFIYNIMVKNKSKDIIFIPDNIQQATINMKINEIELKIYYQSIPVYPDGFDVILRVLPIVNNDEK